MRTDAWNRTNFFMLLVALVLTSACTIKTGDEGEGDDAPATDERGDGTTIGNPDLNANRREGGDGDGDGLAGDGDGDSAGGDGDGAAGDGDGSGGDGDDMANTDTDNSGLTLEPAQSSTPMFPLAECGSLDPSDATASADSAQPTAFEIGELVGGRVDPDSVSNQQHYWQIDVKEGYYHLLLEPERADGRSSNLGLDIHRLDEDGVEVAKLLDGNEIGRRYRDAYFIKVDNDATWQLRVTPSFSAQDYMMALIPNGTPVPSPWFVDCPTVNELPLDQELSFTLEAEGEPGFEEWYALDLDVGDYSFQVEAVQSNGESTNLQYKVFAVDQFAQTRRDERVIWVNEIDRSFTSEGTLFVSEPKSYFVRFVNSNHELVIKFTVTKI